MIEELEGRLVLLRSGYVALTVPNSIVLGAYQALSSPGLMLPYYDGKLNAHITVMRPEDVASIGGSEKITERGKAFKYRLGGLASGGPINNKSEFAKFYFFQVTSPQLAQLRRTYGLSGEPEVPFHITVAYRKPSVLYTNSVTKVAMRGPIYGKDRAFNFKAAAWG